MSSVYANYSREDLIREIEILKAQGTSVNDEKIYQSRFLNNAVALRKTFSEVLSLLITPSQKDIIDQSLLTILRFFNVDRVYIGNFDNDKPTFDFTHEVTSQGTISMREDLLVGLPKADYAWWIKTIREGKDIIIRDTNNMPEEAAAGSRVTPKISRSALLISSRYPFSSYNSTPHGKKTQGLGCFGCRKPANAHRYYLYCYRARTGAWYDRTLNETGIEKRSQISDHLRQTPVGCRIIRRKRVSAGIIFPNNGFACIDSRF